MSDDRPAMSRPLRDLLDAMRPTGCALLLPAERGLALGAREAAALSWHRGKHAADAAHGWSAVACQRLQIAHVRDWPTTKELSCEFPPLVGERRFHSLVNMVLLCPEAHDLYDGAAVFSLGLIECAAFRAWALPQAREPLLRYVQATMEARRGHQTEATNLLAAADILRHEHAVDMQTVVEAFEARARNATEAAEQGDATMVHRGDRALFRMLGASAHLRAPG
jgi:hypothetical protein